MNKLTNYLSYLFLIIIVGFNLWLNFPETKILADPNDNIFQFSLVNRTNWVWENYGCPFSLSCLPNLVDHNVPNWAEGYPLPFYYSHVPQIAIVSSYHLFIQPITKIFNLPARNASASVADGQFSIYNYYNWTRYLLLSLFPVTVYWALKIVGISPMMAAFGAFFAAHISTDGLYGIDPPSYLWRGYGLTSQLYAIIFLPLAIAFTYRALHEISKTKIKNKDIFWATFFLTLTTAGHLGIGIIGILSTIPFLFIDLKLQNIWERFKKLFFVLCSLFFVLSYWIIPILLYNNYHIVSFWDPIWKFNSYGLSEAVKQFFAGEIFDWQRFPIVSILVVIGFFVISLRKNMFPFALLFIFWFTMYFGRTTWGGILDLIPGMKDFHQHRFIVGIHVAALFLIPAGLQYIFSLLKKIVIPALQAASSKFKVQSSKLEANKNIIFYILLFIFTSFLIYFTAKQTVAYAQLNNKWIYQANDAYKYDEQNFKNLLSQIDSSPKGRIYAGRPGNWGKDFRLGSTQLYLLFGGIGYDISQFLPETWSPMSENEQNFDERDFIDYDLLNINTVVAKKNEGFSDKAKLTQKFGPFELYRVPTTGWFDVVTSPMMVKSDKTNYINIVHLWLRSYARRWKMHPLISVDSNPQIPQGIAKIIQMTDEVSYQNVILRNEVTKDPITGRDSSPAKRDQNDSLNIFSDYPFIFPEATVSAKIKDERVNRQTYSATVEVPDNCKQCYVMFKMSYHPDWKVKVDGTVTDKYAISPFYLATSVSPGTHKVEFTYVPNNLKVLLLVGEIAVVILFIFRKKIRALF